MIKIIRSFIFLAILVGTVHAHAAVSPISFGIVRPIQFPPEDFTVTGARISLLWGEHRNMYGLDLGLMGNITEQEFTGLAISGVFNMTMGNTTIVGLQLAGLTNINTNKVFVGGLQLAAGMNINEAASTVAGLQAALLANLSPFTDIYGVQMGLYNRAAIVHGLQIGLVNVTDSLHGFQIGLINFNHKGTFAVSPILNAGF
jgi:hypothetical protein